MAKKIKKLEDYVRSIPDFPKPGILFRDITTLILDPVAFKTSIDILVKKFKDKKITKIVAIESRGFIFGSVLAYKLGIGFVPARKKGKLPGKTISITYSLEYGTDTMEIHDDALNANDKVLIIDDLLATGGTVRAAIDLVEKFKSKIIGIAFLIELVDLKGREKLKNYPITSLIEFEGE